MESILLTALASPELVQSRSTAKIAGDRLLLRTAWHRTTVVRISAAGEVDASNIDRLARYVFRYGANSRRLILDLTDVKFFGVECFSVLNIIADRCTAAAVAWTLISSPAVARVSSGAARRPDRPGIPINRPPEDRWQRC